MGADQIDRRLVWDRLEIDAAFESLGYEGNTAPVTKNVWDEVLS
jgi:hypothetical protein